MPTNKIRTRFAPSPTGFLHIGSLQACLFDYLAAKSLGGEFILRIEDTDQKREVEGAVEALIKILEWVGIKSSENPLIGGKYGPYIQTQRLDIYQKYLQELLAKGEAYHCFCSEERLVKMREEQEAMKLPPRYDRCCRDLSKEEVEKRIAAGEKFVIRQKMPLTGEVVVHEELRGDLKFQAETLDDQILIKSNGVPTYHFASVVDDHCMEITHVLRGSEWLPSFPKNTLLYRSFGWEMPKVFHMPLILNKEGGKLSKRQGDVAVEDFRAKGYLPAGLLNFVVLMGWHPEGDNEILTLADMEKQFDVYKVGTSPAIFDLDKLDYFNGYHIRQMDLDELVKLCRPFLEENFALTGDENKKGDDFLKKVVALSRERLKNLKEITEQSKYFFKEKLDFDPAMLVWRKSDAAGAKAALTELKTFLEGIGEGDWEIKTLEERVIVHIKEGGKNNGDYLWPLRVALTGEKASPSPFEMAWALGKEETISKITDSISKL